MKKRTDANPRMTPGDWFREVERYQKIALEAKDESLKYLLEALQDKADAWRLKSALWDSALTQAQMSSFIAEKGLEEEYVEYQERSVKDSHIKDLVRRVSLEGLLSDIM